MKWNKPGGSKIVNSCCHVIYLQKTEEKHGYHEKKQNKNITKTLKSSTQKNAPCHSHVTLTTWDMPTLLIYGLLLKR